MRTAPLVKTTSYSDNATGDLPCARCGKEVKNPKLWVHVIDGGDRILHPEDEDAYTSDDGDMDMHPIGPECAKYFKGFIHK